ncbi:MAG: bile acid:sodium symporter family protein [Bowdeniella nasicola]|nr:bile acid:sodium symporter family protein [Bowdeniella nasicola]
MAVRHMRVDPFMIAILASALLAFLLPATGAGADVVSHVTTGAIVLLFFGYGARLSVREALAGLTHWRLHLMILACTYLVFPALALALVAIPDAVLSPAMRFGLIFLCLVPSTVQSSITFTSIAGGNIAGAMVSATASNILGVVITPLLALLFLPAHGGTIGLGQVRDVALQLLLPFVLGQLSRPLTAEFMARHRRRVTLLDRVVICLVVYRAFSGFFADRAWVQVRALDFLVMVAASLVILTFMFAFTWWVSGVTGFSRPDRIAIMMCGTKKSLATGVPIAAILFAGQSIGLIVLPLMVFHQAQLMAATVISGRMGRAPEGTGTN